MITRKDKRASRRIQFKFIIRGTAARPRLVINRSNRFFSAQVIDDVAGKTIVAVNKMTSAQDTGSEIAKLAMSKKITQVVFDRAGYKYHGTIKTIADSARAGGLQF